MYGAPYRSAGRAGPVTCAVPPTSHRDVADLTPADRRPRAHRLAHPAPPLRPVGAVRLPARRRARRRRSRRDAVRHRRLDHHRRRSAAPRRTGGTRTTRSNPRSPRRCTSPTPSSTPATLDIIHNGFDFLPLTYSGLVDTAVVTTIHGFSSPRIVPVYERYDATTTYVAISDADRHPALHYAATIHHGIDTDAFAVDPDPGEHLLFFGRIHPDKGTADAIEVAASSRPPPRHRRDHPRPAVLRRAGRAARRRRPGALHRPGRRRRPLSACSARPTPSCTSSTSTSRSATASSRRWPAARRSSPTPEARCRSSSPTASPASSSTASTRRCAAVDAAGALDRAAIRATTVARFDRATMVDALRRGLPRRSCSERAELLRRPIPTRHRCARQPAHRRARASRAARKSR